MIDVEDTLRAELHRLGPVDARPDWDEIAARAGLQGDRKRRRWTVALAVAAAAVVVGAATPLGSAIARELSGFSAWLTGRPGSPVSRKEQRAFDASNARS